jgi:hypothetical protein
MYNGSLYDMILCMSRMGAVLMLGDMYAVIMIIGPNKVSTLIPSISCSNLSRILYLMLCFTAMATPACIMFLLFLVYVL